MLAGLDGLRTPKRGERVVELSHANRMFEGGLPPILGSLSTTPSERDARLASTGRVLGVYRDAPQEGVTN